MTKEEFLSIVNKMPSDTIFLPSYDNEFGMIGVNIFTEQKSKEFIEWCLKK